jgi:hypothetical protein
MWLRLVFTKHSLFSPNVHFSNLEDLAAYLNGKSGRSIDVYFKISPPVYSVEPVSRLKEVLTVSIIPQNVEF